MLSSERTVAETSLVNTMPHIAGSFLTEASILGSPVRPAAYCPNYYYSGPDMRPLLLCYIGAINLGVVHPM